MTSLYFDAVLNLLHGVGQNGIFFAFKCIGVKQKSKKYKKNDHEKTFWLKLIDFL